MELARSYEPEGVAFFAIDANQQDGAAAMGRFANANQLPFPFLKDVANELADRLELGRTSEVLVLDARRAIRYRASSTISRPSRSVVSLGERKPFRGAKGDTYRCAAPNLAKVYELTKKRAQRVTRASIVRINPESCTSQESW